MIEHLDDDQEERDARLTALMKKVVEENRIEKARKEREAAELEEDKTFFSVSVFLAITLFLSLLELIFLSYQPVLS